MYANQRAEGSPLDPAVILESAPEGQNRFRGVSAALLVRYGGLAHELEQLQHRCASLGSSLLKHSSHC